jgi:aspartate kinase
MATRKAPAANEVDLEETDRAFPPGSVIVQKFGGSSLADAAGILRAAERIAKTRTNGYRVVAVVSAMGDTTDELCDLAAEVSTRPLPVELDALLSIGELVSSALLAIALTDLGQVPRTFTGSAAGLITDNIHGRAHIIDVKPDRVRSSLADGEVPIVAGFQGRTQKGDRVTTLGRGGSDLTAVALAAALEADICEIYTDVDGVYTADPRVVPAARKIDILSSEEMLEFAASGSKVLHLRCVEYARRFDLPIHVRSSFVPVPGTLILPGLDRHPLHQPAREQPEVTAVSGVNSTSKITVVGIPDDPDSVACILQVLSRSGADVQAIVQNKASVGGRRSAVSLIVPAAQAGAALAGLHAEKGTIGFEGLQNDGAVGRVSISGLGMRSSPEIFGTFLKALSDADLDLDLFDISETSMGAVTHADRLADAERAVRRAFGMAPAPSDEETVAGRADDLKPLADSPLGTRAAISDHDTTPVSRGVRTVERHFQRRS